MPAYPLVEFELSVGTWGFAGEAYPDTGFEGGLAIPRELALEIDASAYGAPWRLADGSLIRVDGWVGVLTLNGRRLSVEVLALGSRCLLGREILDHTEICFRFGREVAMRFPGEAWPDDRADA
jgi:predicted aspartyl protease